MRRAKETQTKGIENRIKNRKICQSTRRSYGTHCVVIVFSTHEMFLTEHGLPLFASHRDASWVEQIINGNYVPVGTVGMRGRMSRLIYRVKQACKDIYCMVISL